MVNDTQQESYQMKGSISSSCSQLDISPSRQFGPAMFRNVTVTIIFIILAPEFCSKHLLSDNYFAKFSPDSRTKATCSLKIHEYQISRRLSIALQGMSFFSCPRNVYSRYVIIKITGEKGPNIYVIEQNLTR